MRICRDPNSFAPERERQGGIVDLSFHHTSKGSITSASIPLEPTLAAKIATKASNILPEFEFESLVTKILSDEPDDIPRPAGVEDRYGRSFYRAFHAPASSRQASLRQLKPKLWSSCQQAF